MNNSINNLNNQSEYFYNLPNEIIQKIVHRYPIKSALVCKLFYRNANTFLMLQWKLFKTSDKTPSKFKEKMIEIETNFKTNNGFILIREFFRSINTRPKFKDVEVDFGKLGSVMLRSFQCFGDEQDSNLRKLWKRANGGLEWTTNAMRKWMSDEHNQDKLATWETINLSRFSFTNVPPEIIYFSGLKRINLMENKLTSVCPFFFNFTALEILHININQLMVLPSSIGNLTALRILNLADNQLTDLPSSIGNLTKLEELDLSRNLLEVLPSSIGNLTALRLLNLSYNELMDFPSSIGNLTKLEELDLSRNLLEVLPSSIGNLTKLEHLCLYDNLLEDLPSSISNLTRLKDPIDLRKNRLLNLPDSIVIAFKKKIINLQLDSTTKMLIPNYVQRVFGTKAGIENFIKLSGNTKPGSVLEKVCDMIRAGVDKILYTVYREQEALGDLVDQLDSSDKKQLYHQIWSAAFYSNDPAWRLTMVNQDTFYWGQKHRFDCMHLFVSVLGNFLLQKKTEQDNNLYQCWSRIALKLDIEQLPMDANEIRIWMSHEDNQQRLAQIQDLDLSALNLTDIPPEIIYFSGLTVLELRRNKLIVLSDSIGKLTALQHLDLSKNQLMDLSNSFGNLTSLKQLDLSDNQLIDLPSSFRNLTSLEFIDLSSNQLKDLPDLIGDLPGLEVLDLNNNLLNALPHSIVNAGQNTGSLLELTLEDNLPMLIPECVLDKFKSNKHIISFINLRDGTPRSALENVCQMIRIGSDKILNDNFTEKKDLKSWVEKLDPNDQKQIYHRIGQLAWNKNDVKDRSLLGDDVKDRSLLGDDVKDSYVLWGEQNCLTDMRLFVRVLGELLYQKQNK